MQPELGRVVFVPFNRFDSAAEVLDNFRSGRVLDGAQELLQQLDTFSAPDLPRGPRGLSQHVFLECRKLRFLSRQLYGFESPRMGHDDRFADNMDLIFDGFRLVQPGPVLLPDRRHVLVAALEGLSDQAKEFLIRTPPEYLQLLYVHCKVNTPTRLEAAVAEMHQRAPGGSGYSQGIKQRATEYISELPVNFLELLITNCNISSVPALVQRTDSQGLQELCRHVRNFPSKNFCVLTDLGKFPSEAEFLRTFRSKVFLHNLEKVDFAALRNIYARCSATPAESQRRFLAAVTSSDFSSVTQYIHDLDSALGKRTLPEEYLNFLEETLDEADYLQQNMYALRELERAHAISSRGDIAKLRALKEYLGGFVTPLFAQRYLAAATPEEDKGLLTDYALMRDQVLSSQAVDIKDPAVLAEIIFHAYRPIGFDIPTIQRQIQHQEVEDLSTHLDGLRYERQGYPMRVNLALRSVRTPFDIQALAGIDRPLGEHLPLSEVVTALRNVLNNGPAQLEARRTVLAHTLSALADTRVEGYEQDYLRKVGTRDYGEARLSRLLQILQVIPHEDCFIQGIDQALAHKPELLSAARGATEQALWFGRKGRCSTQERQCKTKIDQILKELAHDAGTDVRLLLQAPELEILGGDVLQKLQQEPKRTLASKLRALKFERFLGCKETELDSQMLALFSEALKAQARADAGLVQRELGKVTLIRVEDTAEVTAVLSKNVGSFYAKASADLCTKGNTAMWREKRHLHLNLVCGKQVIGNVMVYLEDQAPHHRYLVARGFNPRDDALWKFDHESLALETARVLQQIAKDNNRREIFITDQTGWHALSNRDVYAQVVLRLAAHQCSVIKRQRPRQRTVIHQANFIVTEKPHGATIDTLKLLALADLPLEAPLRKDGVA